VLPSYSAVNLVVPVKALSAAKTRLRGAADHGIGEPGAHARLAIALAHDTIAAVRGTVGVRRLLVVSSDPVVAAELAAVGVEVVPDGPVPGLNEAYRHGAAVLRRDDDGPVAALQADLPALRPSELDEAITAALKTFATGAATSAFCADTEGTGTTFLVAAAGTALDPRFGVGSAGRHQAAGAAALTGDWPGLRRDVDTSDDLRAAAELGLGANTRCVLAPSQGC